MITHSHHEIDVLPPLAELVAQLNPKVLADLSWPGIALINGVLENA